MKRILFCLNGPNESNGPNVWLTRHLPLLARENITPEVLYLSYEPKLHCSFRHELQKSGITFRTAKLHSFIEDSIRSILHVVLDDLPDFFVPNYSLPAYYSARFLRESGVSSIATLHSDDPYYHKLVEMFVTGEPEWRLSGVVAVSKFWQQAMQKKASQMPLLYAPCGTPLPTTRARWQPDRLSMLYFGRLTRYQKRIDRVAEYMAAAAQHEKVEGIIYGSGDAQLVNTLLNTVDGGDQIHLGGLVMPDQVQARMLLGQVFVLLSDFEGLSIALMEAMACGLVPVVSNMQSGVDEIIDNGINGFIIDPGDKSAFIEIIHRLADDESYWTGISQAARATILEADYTSSSCALRWVDFLHDLPSEGTVASNSLPDLADDLLPNSRFGSTRKKAMTAAAQGRPVFLWGAGKAGEMFLAGMADDSLTIAGFIDMDVRKLGGDIQGYIVHGPDYLLECKRTGRRPFVIITSQYDDDISSQLKTMGFDPDQDYGSVTG